MIDFRNHMNNITQKKKKIQNKRAEISQKAATGVSMLLYSFWYKNHSCVIIFSFLLRKHRYVQPVCLLLLKRFYRAVIEKKNPEAYQKETHVVFLGILPARGNTTHCYT